MMLNTNVFGMIRYEVSGMIQDVNHGLPMGIGMEMEMVMVMVISSCANEIT